MKFENILKHSVKRKVSFTESLLVLFLITGGISYAAVGGEIIKEYLIQKNNEIDYGNFEFSESKPTGDWFKINDFDGKNFYFQLKNNSGDIITNLGERKDEHFNGSSITQTFYNCDHTTSDFNISGGALFNRYGSIKNITGDFINNCIYNFTYNTYGGAIHNKLSSIENITGDFIKNSAYSYKTYTSYGGAIYNEYSTIGSIIGNFLNNNAMSQSSSSYGGAIANNSDSSIGDIIGNFIANYASSFDRNAYGGAIYNGSSSSNIKKITGDFIENYTFGSDSLGGAIHNVIGSSIESITGDFIGNFASGFGNVQGGAIYNGGTLALKATADNSILFEGNKVTTTDADGNVISSVSNAIHNEGTIDLLAEAGSSITFNDRITGTDSGIFNIGDANHNGDIVINANMTEYLGTVNFNNGTIKIGENNKVDGKDFNDFFGNGMNLVGNNIKLDSVNNKMDNLIRLNG